jgi:multidrug efflux pump subunit AcrA (membrane-fusion protein)
MKKKIIISVVAILIVSAMITGGIFIFRSYHKNGLVADVYPVASLNVGYSGDQSQSYGTVTNNISQDIVPESGQTISQVYVKEGQTVAIGDKLMEYDISDKANQLELKKLDIQQIENKIALGQKDLAELKNTKPVVVAPITNTPDTSEPSQPETETEVPEKTGLAYNYISQTAKAYVGNGSEKKPFHFLCTQSAYVYGSYLNYLKEKSYTAVFEIRKDNKTDGTLVTSWTVNGSAMDKADDASKWSVLNRQKMDNETESESETKPQLDTSSLSNSDSDAVADVDVDADVDTDTELGSGKNGLTASALAKKIAEKEKQLKDLDVAKRTAQLEQQKLEKDCNSGVVNATINGIVKKVGDTKNLPKDGTPFLSVAGSEGLYITGNVSEMLLSQVKTGQIITATSWNNGNVFQATITEISKYPLDGNNYSGDGNPNASYYPFTAYIKDSTGLTNGDGVQISMSGTDENTNTSDMICIDKPYIRTEKGRAYVWKADEHDRLVKQYITTGKKMFGQVITITGGLSMDDRIAFPYGKTAQEGVKVKDSDSAQE